MSENNEFSEFIQKIMRERNLSQAELARRANVSRAAVNGVIRGRRRPGRDLLGALAISLNIPAEDLFRAAGVSTIGSERPIDLAEWIGLYQSADKETREEMIRYARYLAETNRKGKSA